MTPAEALAAALARDPERPHATDDYALELESATRGRVLVRQGRTVGYDDRIGYVALAADVVRVSAKKQWRLEDAHVDHVIWPYAAPSVGEVVNWLSSHNATVLRDVVETCYPDVRLAERVSAFALRTYVGYAWQVAHPPSTRAQETAEARALVDRWKLRAAELLLGEEDVKEELDEDEVRRGAVDARRRFAQLAARTAGGKREEDMKDEPGSTATPAASPVKKKTAAPAAPAPAPAEAAASKEEKTVVKGTKPTAGAGSKKARTVAKAVAKKAKKDADKKGKNGDGAASRIITDASTLKGTDKRSKERIAAAQKLKVDESYPYSGRHPKADGKKVKVVGYRPDGGLHVEFQGERFACSPFSVGEKKKAAEE